MKFYNIKHTCLSADFFLLLGLLLYLTSTIDLSVTAFSILITLCSVTAVWWLAAFSRRQLPKQKKAGDENLTFAKIARSNPNPLLRIDRQGFVRLANAAAERLLRGSNESILGLPLQDLIPACSELDWTRIEQANTACSLTAPIDSAFYQFTFQGFKDSQAIHVYGSDITEQKKTEEQLRNALSSAHAEVKLKSEFLATMSHEIRTPMNGILGMTELLLDSDLTEEQIDNAKIILASGESLLSLINDILDFSKIEAGKLELEHTEFDLRSCIEEVAELFAPRIQGKGLEFPVYVEPEIPLCVMGDPGRFKQIVTNLVSNAVKFTSQGEIRIHCSLVDLDGSFATIRVDVCDTGIGIPKDKQHSLFESFTQADASTTRQYGGTGLGLSISLQLAQAMGGLIAVHSNPGAGSLFSFGARFQRPVEADDEHVLFENHRHCRVLLCMSNESNQRGIRALFANWKCETLAVNDADQALELIRFGRDADRHFHLLLLDYDTVRSNLESFLQTIRRETQEHPIAILLMSGVHDRKKAQDSGFAIDGFLTKPVKREQLARLTRKVLGDEQKMKRETTHADRAAANAPNSPKDILVVEDNPVNQKLATRMLEKAGHRVRVAENGKAALAALRERRCDLILMDCQMPVMDGYEATAEIRRGKVAPDIPIIGLTANALQGDRATCLEAGMNDYLQKPYKPAELLAKVNQWAAAQACESD
ncbi:response regulator [bacterium]|nr:response regulator [bacterium]